MQKPWHAARQIVLHSALALAVGLGFGLLLLLLDVAGLGRLVLASGERWSLPVFLLGAVLALAPAFICTGIGLMAGATPDIGAAGKSRPHRRPAARALRAPTARA